MSPVLLDGKSVSRPHPEVVVEDQTLQVCRYDGVVRAGLGAVIYASDGVVVDAGSGSEIHLAPGAALEEEPPPGALESLDVCVVRWDGGAA